MIPGRADWITPAWPAPAGVRAVTTTRTGGESRPPWASLNLGNGCGDEPATVARNRTRVLSALGIEDEPCWLDQVHGSDAVSAMRYVPTQASASPARHHARC